jgi:hypothetical protein
MLEKYFVAPKTLRRLRAGLSGPHILADIDSSTAAAFFGTGYATVSSSVPSSSTTGPPRLDAGDTLTRFPQAIPPPTA